MRDITDTGAILSYEIRLNFLNDGFHELRCENLDCLRPFNCVQVVSNEVLIVHEGIGKVISTGLYLQLLGIIFLQPLLLRELQVSLQVLIDFLGPSLASSSTTLAPVSLNGINAELFLLLLD